MDDQHRYFLRAQLLFADVEQGVVHLDFIVLGGERDPHGPTPPRGTPITLVLETPDSRWWAGRMAGFLTEWAADCRLVTIEMRNTDHGLTATLSADRTQLSFGLPAEAS